MSSRLRRTAGSLLAAATLVCAAASCTNAEPPRTPVAKPPGDTVEETSVTVPAVSAPPSVTVEILIDGLDHPWDVVRAPDGTLLTGERGGRFVVRRPDGQVTALQADLSDLYAVGETGLMGLALSDDFATDRTFYSCQGHRDPDDVRVLAWTVDPDWTTATRARTVVSGMPVAAGGRHAGCRILVHPDGTLYVGTGDSARPTVPQDRASLGGKVLHLNPDGTPAAGNPDPGSPIYTLGHRNVQGLALQPGTGRIYAVEQGTRRDDEVNLLEPGGNYGYRPDREPGRYDESVPMTDPDRVPGAIGAVWSSGSPTIATPGLAFVTGDAWGPWSGALVVSSQQAARLILLKLSEDGRSVVDSATLLEDTYGRLRSLTPLPDGSLLVTTDNGDDDRILRVIPN
ncbi:PQQ-dependent sugar dehydrogenase [Rhodococcus sp. HM1]|uniref:PQQ-dependent sugar dehydrogenase n=1 Tax=Rhodococcus sp. HM1 TaxID=2937759 RepID=UPI00200A199B|nr:PQQ-dependent sugar dehydrogenase [Rhodococcus sp. HM1]MCK8672605.1 PQQ-dependent sugar dehydrogenase [Rhodococcus sp. HM1]